MNIFKKNRAFYVLLALAFFAPTLYLSTKFLYKHISRSFAKNIVIIELDSLSTKYLPCYESKENLAPNICKLASRGITFNHHIAPSFWTVPSFTSFHTGYYPTAHQYWSPGKDFISEDFVTLASKFSDNGYSTTIVANNANYVGSLSGESTRGFENTTYSSAPFWAELVEKKNTSNASGDKPYLIYFYSDDLHDPYLLEEGQTLIEDIERPKDYAKDSQDFMNIFGTYLIKNNEEIFKEEAVEEHKNIFSGTTTTEKAQKAYKLYYEESSVRLKKTFRAEHDYYTQEAEKDPLFVKYMEALYKTRLYYFDKDIESLVSLLSEKPYSKNTVVVFTTSHGEAFGEHDLITHEDSLYNALLRIPLIIVSPGYSPKRVDVATRNIDVYPTIMELVNLKKDIPKEIQGKSLVGLMSGSKGNMDRFAYSQIAEGFWSTYSIQNSKYKLIVKSMDENTQLQNPRLYNLNKDPDEWNDISENNEEIIEDFLVNLRKIYFDSLELQKREVIPFPDFIEEETRENIIKEGYF